LKLGGTAGRVGASLAGEQVLGLLRAADSRDRRRRENMVRNAVRIVETLGELKGAAMKVGQMLSLHEGLLPREVSEVLHALQKEVPQVPAEVMEYEVRGALPGFDEVFAELSFEAEAAASIGQVHRGRLRDGREVAVKIQYPLIDQVVMADLANLKTLLKSLFALVSDVDFEPVWSEVRARLVEELDYTHEAANLRRMAELHDDVPEIVIPAVIDRATTRNVLTMEYIGGVSPARACSLRYGHELRSRWGVVLFEFVLRGLLVHRFLHADPNLANFAFLEDGRVVVYDFGCVKEVPEELAQGYARLLLVVIEERFNEVSGVLQDMGVERRDGSPLPDGLIRPYLEIFAPIFRPAPPFVFGEDRDLYRKLISLGTANWGEASDLVFPEDAVFIDRAMAGLLGNLNRLGAEGPWREIALDFARRAAER
jgi:predicted unusual protein kinase regulating ubiquinone biosynthesis (AarF/ABC1/UbiB family)